MIEDEIINGNWFLPGDEKNCFNGKLSFGPNSPIRLTLVSTLETSLAAFSFSREDYAVWGYDLNGQPITLLECNRLNWGGISDIGTQEATFNARFIILGKFINSINSEDFTSTEFSLNNLEKWVGKYGSYISYNEPFEITFKLNENVAGCLRFWNTSPLDTVEQIASLRDSIIELKFNKSFSLIKVTEYIYRFQQFCSFMMFSQVGVRSIYLMSGKQKIRLFYRQADGILSDKIGSSLIPFTFISNTFESVVKKWFEISFTITPIINILYANIEDNEQFIQNNFLNIVQAVEAFHRRRIQDTEKLKAENDKLVSKILEQIENENDKKWLQEKLSYSYEPNLRKRLKSLIEQHKLILFTEEPKTKRINAIIKKIVDKRNYYTHFDPSLEKTEEDFTTLFRLTTFLKLLLTYCLLNEIGMDSLFLNDKIYRRFRVGL